MPIESVMLTSHLISSSASSFSICLQSSLASGSFPMSCLFVSGGQILELQHQSFNECSGLISFRVYLFDLLAVQGTLKIPLQHHNWKDLILQCSASFMLQLSHPYTTTGKIIGLTMWTFVSKATSLLFNTLSVCHSFCSKEKCLLISWLQSSSAVISESKKIKTVTTSTFYLLWSVGTRKIHLSCWCCFNIDFEQKSLRCVWLFETPWGYTVHGILRPEYPSR